VAVTKKNEVSNGIDEVKMAENKYQLNKEMQLETCMKISAVNEDERTVTAVISSDAIDRDREVLMPKGMDADNFSKNPVVLWAHDSGSPPIGKALWVKQKGKRITAKVQFATSEFASEIWELFKGKFLTAFSVGFIPKDGHSPTPADIKRNPMLADARFIITEWELLEFSAVPVPANPEALMQAVKSKSLTLSDTTKDLFQEVLHEEDFEKHIDCQIKDVEDEITEDEELDIEVKAIPEPRILPDIEVRAVPVDVADITSETIKKLKGVMY
jgi:HK97 family phage prohead protease